MTTRLIRWSLLTVTTTALLVSSTPLSTNPYHEPPRHSPLAIAPLIEADHPHGTINNSYIVVLKDDVSPALIHNHMNFLQTAHEVDPLVGEDALTGVQHLYEGHLNGYAGRFTDAVVEQIRYMPEVAYVEKDQIVRISDMQKAAPWGLARISHRRKLTLGTFTKYMYDPQGGEGVDVYVIDTGINVDHDEFEGRASWGKTMAEDDMDEDANGHGTHCAGTIASRKYGVAKGANVIAVKVLGSNGSGTMSDVIGGVLWAATSAKQKADAASAELAATGKTSHKGSVANMSLGGGKSQALDDTVNKAVAAGLHFAVAAGNDGRDACQFSPAAAQMAVTVGASTLGDEMAYFSNHGPCVDVFAPGLNILSTYKGGRTATATMSGTSMASPHTAGLLAYLLSIYPSKTFNPKVTPDFVPIMLDTAQTSTTESLSSMYTMAHAALPSWVTAFLPPPRLLDVINVAPVPPEQPETLTPLQLKKALIALSTRGILGELPEKTVNLLIFNNASAVA